MSELVYALRRQRRGWAVWAAGLAAYCLLIIAMWPSIRRSSGSMQDYLDAMPRGFVKAFGITDMTTPAGYLGAELMSLMLPLLVTIAGVNLTLALTAAFEDAGYFETVLALPVTRTGTLLARWAAVMVVLACHGAVLFGVLLAGGAATDMGLPAGRVAAAVVALLTLAVLHAAIGYLGAGVGLGRPAALGLAVGAAVLGYAVSSLFPLVDALSGAARYSPWHWTVGQQPLRDGLPAGGVLALLAISAVLVAAGTLAANRRDVRIV